MYTKQQSDDAVRKRDDAERRKQLITFEKGLPDREIKEVLWGIYGVIDTNEIIVVASTADRSFGATGPSPLLWPAMIDRRFGMDVDDRTYAGQMADRLVPLIKQELRR